MNVIDSLKILRMSRLHYRREKSEGVSIEPIDPRWSLLTRLYMSRLAHSSVSGGGTLPPPPVSIAIDPMRLARLAGVDHSLMRTYRSAPPMPYWNAVDPSFNSTMKSIQVQCLLLFYFILFYSIPYFTFCPL